MTTRCSSPSSRPFPTASRDAVTERSYSFAAGGPASLAPNSTVATAPFLIAVEAEDRRDQKAPLVRIASAIEPEWLIDLFPDRVRETNQAEWNRSAERVEAVSALWFGQIAIQESRGIADPEAAAAMLAAKAMETGLARFTDVEEIDAFLERTRFAALHGPVPVPDVREALASLAYGLKSFSELEAAARGAGLVRALENQLPSAARRLREELAPDRIRLPGGRAIRVHYEPAQTPWIASRLQDFFGMRETPAIARGAVPLVIRLLAPNQRPVQTTTDLAGFWQRLYPQVRKELSRRYPNISGPRTSMTPDEQAIRGIISTWQSATARDELDRILPLMSEDVVFLTPGNLPMQGRETFAAASRANAGQVSIEASAEIVEVHVSGDMAYAWTNLSVTITPRSGGVAMHRRGPTLSIFRKTAGGGWVLSRDANLLAAS